MFSKLGFLKFIRLLLTLTMAVSMVGCVPEWGEKPPDDENIQLASTQCLSRAATQLKEFFEAKATPESLKQAWDCVELAFLQFEKYVHGRNEEHYTSQEIVDFLKKNFFTDIELQKHQITPKLQIELMRIKQIFVGGNVDYVTREELRSSPAVFRRLRELSVQINPYMKIIVMNWKPNLNMRGSADLEEFEVSNLAMQEFVKNLAHLIQANESQYKLDYVVNLVREFEKFFGEKWDWVEDLEKFLPGARKLKVALAGGAEEHITNLEWAPVLTLGARGYYQFLRYHYFIRNTHETGSGIGMVYIARTLEDSFSLFRDMLVNKKAGFISRREIYELLKAFEGVWEDLRVSEPLILEFMKIKQLLIGGSVESFTVEDFEQARQDVPKYRKIIEGILPYYRIYIFDWDHEFYTPEKAREIFTEGRLRLLDVIKDFSSLLKGTYSFHELLSVLQEVEHLFPSEDGDSVYEEFKKFEPLFIEANRLLFQREDSVVTEEAWSKLLPLVGKFYSLYQYYDFFMVGKSIRTSRMLTDLGELVEDGVQFAQDLIGLKKEGHFTQSELVQLSLTLSKADILPATIQESTYQGLWTLALQHILFDPEKRRAGEKNDKLGYSQLRALRDKLINWQITQLALNKVFKNNESLSFEPDELMRTLHLLIYQPGQSPVVKEGLKGVFDLLKVETSQTLDSKNRLEVSNRKNWRYRLNAVFQANLSRTLSRLLIEAFSNDEDLHRVDRCEAHQAFDLINPLLQDLDLFDLGGGFIDSRFLEANIFMIRGNGDNYLDKFELAEVTTVIFSGLVVHNDLKNSLQKNCRIYKGAKDKEFVTFNCLSEHYYVAVRKYMDNLPEFKTFVEKIASKDKSRRGEADEVSSRSGYATWRQVFRATLKATGWKANKGFDGVKEESVYIDDTLYYPFILHYMEILYAKYDYSRVDGIIQTVEAQKAFPTFRPLLKELAQDKIDSGLISEDDLLAVFTFILRYQEEPGFSNLFRWLRWKSMKPHNWDVWVSRTELASILEFIADKVESRSRSLQLKNRCEGKASNGNRPATPVPDEIDPWGPWPPQTPSPETPSPIAPSEPTDPPSEPPPSAEDPSQSDEGFPDFGDDFPDFDEEFPNVEGNL